MQIITPARKNIMTILGKPKTSENGAYRFMHYVVSTTVDDGVLVYHTLTGELLLLAPEEYEKADTLLSLREKWFVVPESLPDKAYTDRARFILKTTKKDPLHRSSFTIFTTTDCNARCYYCYELGCSRNFMSEETAEKTADYIIQESRGEKVFLSWFGGEPLYNSKVIDIISERLKESGIEYESSMITNGYLFDEEAVKKASELWKVTDVQITLDGTEEVYNRVKAYIYKEAKSPYQIVMDNIGRLLEMKIPVIIRMNVNDSNAEDLMQLAKELHDRFGNRLSAYSHPLFEYSVDADKRHTTQERTYVYRQHQKLRAMLKEYGLYHASALPRKFPVHLCMADGGSAVTILPGGEIGLCNRYIDSDFAGNVESGKLDREVLNRFRETKETIAECTECFYYPLCIRLKLCAEGKECFSELRFDLLETMKDSMQVVFKSWLNEKSRKTKDKE